MGSSLNLFHRQPGALPHVDLAVRQALADFATIGILAERARTHNVRLSEVAREVVETNLAAADVLGAPPCETEQLSRRNAAMFTPPNQCGRCDRSVS